jgi:N-acetylornithine carbamoyltransferase
MEYFNDLTDHSTEEINELLQLAQRLDLKPEPRALEGKVLSLLFLSQSLRTLASFQAAMTRLGGGTFVISPEMSIHGLESRSGIVMDGQAAEHFREAIPVIASYGDAIGIRASAKNENLDDDLEDSEFKSLTSLINIPYVNMESAINHPCQSLADFKTMNDLATPTKGGKFVLSWSWHPETLPLAIPASTLKMAAMRGMDITILRPEGFSLPNSVMQHAQQLIKNSDGSIKETTDRSEAMEGANIIYASSWAAQNHYADRAANDKMKNGLRDWCIDEPWFEPATKDCRFMHCLPVRRGVTVTDAVLDGPRSIVIHEARNRMLVQMAVLHQMLSSRQR